MTADVQALLDMAEPALTGFAFVFLRVGAAMALLPTFGEQSIPMRVRLVLAIAFSLVIAPSSVPAIDAVIGQAHLIRITGVEVLAGLAMGMGLRIVVMAIQIAGAIAAQATSLAQIFGTNSIEPLPAIGHILATGGLALLAVLGLHVHLAEYLILSYILIPPALAPDAAALAEWGTARVAQAFALAFSLSAPFVLASFVYNVALGVINRAMPQLMVAFVGAPALTMGGLIVLFLSAPLILSVWSTAVLGFLANPDPRF